MLSFLFEEVMPRKSYKLEEYSFIYFTRTISYEQTLISTPQTILVLPKVCHCLSPETINISRTRIFRSLSLQCSLETIQPNHTYTPRSDY
jgi:hypothetical protein